MTVTAFNYAVGTPAGRPALLINRCAELGITLTVDGGVLHVDAPDLPYVDAFLDELANHKPAILDALTYPQNPHNPQNRTDERPNDPRPDLTDDHRLWVYLLRWAWLDDNLDALGALHGVRCCGAQLEIQSNGALRIVAGPAYLGGWEADKSRHLAPHRTAITGWLRAIAESEQEADARAIAKGRDA